MAEDKTRAPLAVELKRLRKRIAELEASETKLRRAEQELQFSEGKYRSLIDAVLDSSQVGIVLLDAKCNIVWVNQSLECYFGLRKNDVLEKDMRRLICDRLQYIFEDPKDFMNKALATIKKSSTKTSRFECHVLADDEREEWWLEHWAQPINSGPYTGGVVEYYADITERKRAEEALRQSELKYSTLVEKGNDGVIVIQDGLLKFANPKMVGMTGFSIDEVRNKPFIDLVSTEYRQLAADRYRKRMSGQKTPSNSEIAIISKDGGKIPVEVNATVIEYEGKPADMAIIRDIAERRQAQEALERAAQEWRTTFDSITDLISIHDSDFRLVRLNKAFAKAFKAEPEQLLGKRCYELVHGTNSCIPHCPVKQTFDTRKPSTLEFFESCLGLYLEVSCSPVLSEKGEVISCVHVARDVTARRQMQEQLMLADRLASIGELASGIAHELNNPLTGVIGFAQLALERDVPDSTKEDLEVIYHEAQRAAETVKHLLSFARKHAPAKQLVNVNELIEKVLELRDYEQKLNNIMVVKRFDIDLPEIMADYFQLQQVFLNIIINAEYFMIEAHGKGTLIIATGKTGDCARITFTDDGPGITKENLKRIFDPFFTTKAMGKGTGLGLSICHGVVTAHGGRIHADSQIGRGATFIVELPISTKIKVQAK